MNNFAYIYTKGANKYDVIMKYSYPSCQTNTDLTDEDKRAIKNDEYAFVKEKCGDCEVKIIPRVVYDLYATRFFTKMGYPEKFGILGANNLVFESIYKYSITEYGGPLVMNEDTRFVDEEDESQAFEDLVHYINLHRKTINIEHIGSTINDYIWDRIQKFKRENGLEETGSLKFNHYYKIVRKLYEKIYVGYFIKHTQNAFEIAIDTLENRPEVFEEAYEYIKMFIKEKIKNSGTVESIRYTEFYSINKIVTKINAFDIKFAQFERDLTQKLVQNFSQLAGFSLQNLFDMKKEDREYILQIYAEHKAEMFIYFALWHLNLIVTTEHMTEDFKIAQFFIDTPQAFIMLMNTMRQCVHFISNHMSKFFSHISLLDPYKVADTSWFVDHMNMLFDTFYRDRVKLDFGKYMLTDMNYAMVHRFMTEELKERKYKYHFNYLGTGEKILTLLGNVLVYEFFPKKNLTRNCILLYRAVNTDRDDIVCKPQGRFAYNSEREKNSDDEFRDDSEESGYKYGEDEYEEDEYKEDEYEIYEKTKEQAYLLSFNTSVLSGSFFDTTACTLHYMLKSKYHYVYYTEKTFAENRYDDSEAKFVPNRNINFEELFYIPPLTPIEQLFGYGEFWHTRNKGFIDDHPEPDTDKTYIYDGGCGVNGSRFSLMYFLRNNMTKDQMIAEFAKYLKTYRKDIAQELLDKLTHRTTRTSPEQTRRSRSKSRSKSTSPDVTKIP